MRFKEFYFKESYIIKVNSENNGVLNGRVRYILKQPKIAELPEDIRGVDVRIISVMNDDNMVVNFVYDPLSKEPKSVIITDSNTEVKQNTTDQNTIKWLWNKYMTEEGYNGEVRIHPPFINYKEHSTDVDVNFFTDFDNTTAVYKAPKTIWEPLEYWCEWDDLSPEQQAVFKNSLG